MDAQITYSVHVHGKLMIIDLNYVLSENVGSYKFDKGLLENMMQLCHK